MTAMTAPLKSIEGTSIADAMADIGRRAKAAARTLALSPAAQRDKALGAMAQAIRDSEAGILAANAEDVAEAKADGTTPAFLDRLSLDAEARRRDGGRHRGGARPGRSGRRRDGKLDAAERHDHRARARAARRRRRDLRKPPERDGGRGGALPQGRQCRDPARRLGELPLRARHPCGAGRRPARRRSARGRDPARADARPRRGRPDARRARRQYRRDRAARRQGPGRAACRPRRACRCSRISKAWCMSMSTRPPISEMAKDDRAERQDAPHRRLRRGRDPAGRSRRRADACSSRSSPCCSMPAARCAAMPTCRRPTRG